VVFLALCGNARVEATVFWSGIGFTCCGEMGVVELTAGGKLTTLGAYWVSFLWQGACQVVVTVGSGARDKLRPELKEVV